MGASTSGKKGEKTSVKGIRQIDFGDIYIYIYYSVFLPGVLF